MSAENCVCGTLNNTGTPTCPSIMDIVKQLVFVASINAAGNDAFVKVTAAKLFVNVENYLNVATDIKSRWLPSPELENLTDERDEPVYHTFTSGKKAFVRDGFRNFYAFIPNGDNDLLARLKNLGNCTEIGAFGLDQSSNLIGSKRKQSAPYANLYPILIDKSTWYVGFVKGKDNEVMGIGIMFQWKSTEKDEDITHIPSSEMNWSREQLYGLLDVYGTAGAITTTSLVVDLFLKTGSTETEALTGLLLANFSIYNKSNSAAVAVATATESVTVPGKYTLTFLAQTSGDQLMVSIAKNRYDSGNAPTALQSVDFLIP